MSGPELAAAFNEMLKSSGAATKPVAKFESIEVGVRRCKELERAVEMSRDGGIPMFLRRFDDRPKALPKTETSKEDLPRGISSEADLRWRNWVPSREQPRRPRKASFARQVRLEKKEEERRTIAAVKSPSESLESKSTSKRAGKVIRLKCANPRRPGTDAHRYFDSMAGGPTVSEYLAKFPKVEQRKAAQWLWNTCKDGYAELLG